jgi:hypothetical protein
MKQLLFSLTAMLLVGSAVRANPAPAEKPKSIDVAVLLDTSGSMDGLIESAKIKLWAIVNDLAKIQPAPNLRVALYQYGNDGVSKDSGWVRLENDLTNDLDEIYKKLNALRTNGGTELVARVTQTALKDLKWNSEKDALKLIFVCGNEPANQDKQVSLEEVAKLAKEKQVFVNTIYCGNANSNEAKLWKEFAQMCGGKYNTIDQNRTGSEVVIATPFDKELNELNESLNKTYLCYGKGEAQDKAKNQLVQDANALKAAPEANFGRIGSKASGLYRNDSWDLVDRMKNDAKFDWKTLKDEELPEEMRKLKPEEREAFLKKKTEEREGVRKKITELTTKRSAFVAEEMKKQPKSAQDKAFDAAVRTTLREQAATKGIEIPE